MTTPEGIRYEPAIVAPLLAGKTALVTGATRGIGRGIAIAMAAAGAEVIVSGRDEANARAVVEEIGAAGGRAAHVICDLADEAHVDALLPAAIERFGKIDVLVNNAGIDADALALDYPLDWWRRVIRFDLEIPFRLSQAVAKHLIERGAKGSIINIASVLGLVGLTEACSYAAAKHGLIGVSKVMAVEWSAQGVRVNVIAPGLIQTDMTKYVWGSDAGSQYIAGRIPMGRIGQPRDIGGVAVFLASDMADFVQGETIAVDGGFLAT